MPRIEEIDRLHHLDDLRSDWLALSQRIEGGGLFQTYEWVTSWIETFWRDRPLRFLTLRDNGRLRGIAPLLVDSTGELGCRQSLCLPVHPHAKRSDFIYEGDAETFCEAVVGHLADDGAPTRLAVGQIEDGSPTVAALESIAPRLHHSVVRMPGSPSPVVRLDGDWEDYLASRSRRVRHELRRKLRRIERRGEIRIVVETESDRCGPAMNDVMRIERRCWKERAGTSFSAEAGLEHFYRTFATRCAERGWLRLYLLYVDDRPVAHLYGVVHGNRYHALKTSFDERYGELSPGTVLFVEALRDAHGLDLETFDFLGDASRWKNEMATGVQDHVALCVVPKTALRCLVCRAYQHRVKPFVKNRLPGLAAAGRRLRAI